MNEVALVPEPTALAPVDVLASPPAVQPSAGVLMSDHKFHGCGIYGFENTVTGLFYVGQTLDFWRRCRDELKKLRIGEHHCKHLQRSFSKHGEQSFRLHVLQRCKQELLNDLELWWIHEKKTTVGVYNSKTSSECGRFWTTTDEVAELHSKNKKDLWALPLFAYSQQKKMWSDDRKKKCRDDYKLRMLSALRIAGFDFKTELEAMEYTEKRIMNGASFQKLMIEFGFYKQQWQRFCKVFEVKKHECQEFFRTKIMSAKHGDLSDICSLENYSIHAAYQVRHRKRRTGITRCGDAPTTTNQT